MLELNHDLASSSPEKLASVMLTEHVLVAPRKENLKKNPATASCCFLRYSGGQLNWASSLSCRDDFLYSVLHL